MDAAGKPPLLQIAVMMPAFGRELRPTSPSWWVVRWPGWTVGPVAHARGYRSGRESPGEPRQPAAV